MRLILIISAFFLIVSCKSGKSGSNQPETAEDAMTLMVREYYEKLFMPDDEGVVRGFNFGQTQSEIEEVEKKKLELVESNELMSFYEITLSDDTTRTIDYAEIKYFYDSNKKFDIATINYYIEDSTTNIMLFDIISKKYEEKYGHSYVDVDGYTVWTSENIFSSGFDIAMKMKKLLNMNEPGITLEFTKF